MEGKWVGETFEHGEREGKGAKYEIRECLTEYNLRWLLADRHRGICASQRIAMQYNRNSQEPYSGKRA